MPASSTCGVWWIREGVRDERLDRDSVPSSSSDQERLVVPLVDRLAEEKDITTTIIDQPNGWVKLIKYFW